MEREDSSPALPKAIGRYEVIRLVGEGAMGRVLLAHDSVLGREVAVKLLRDDLAIPREVREGLVVRMRHEARAAARVTHPNLVTLHDLGQDDDLGLFLVFEYVEGPTLKQRLLSGRLPPAEVASLARDLGAALTCAHKAGILHRDVKPENVILSGSGGKIADFGIARIPDSTLTHVGGLLGTPAYSAPETFRTGTFSAASDQFSLAASLYEALSGRRAFPGDDAVAVTAKIAHEEPDAFARDLDLPRQVDDVLTRALCKDPAGRFASCEVFGRALADAIGRADPLRVPARQATISTKSMPPRARLSSIPPAERKTAQVVMGGAVVVVTAALLIRTALRNESSADDPVIPATAASPSTSAVPSVKPTPTVPVLPHRPRPRPDASARTEVDAGTSKPDPSGTSSASPSATALPAVPASSSAVADTSSAAPPTAQPPDGGH